MAMTIECECGKKLRVPENAAGRRARCPACGHTFVVPAPPIIDEPEFVSAGEQPDHHEQDHHESDHGEPDHHEPDHEESDQYSSDESRIGLHSPSDSSAFTSPDSLPGPMSESRSADDDSPSNPYDIVDDTDIAAQKAAARAAAQRRAEFATRAAKYEVKPRPAPVIPIPAAQTDTRQYRYLILLLTLIPLIWSTFKPDRETFVDHVQQAITAHPEVEAKLENINTKQELFDILPNHRFDGALLSYDTSVHWLFAGLSAAGFFALIILLFPPGHTKIIHLFFVGLFTGTLGILLLLALQWAAFHVPLRIGASLITIIIDLIWLIGQSYSMAMGNHGLVLSVLGFTAGVGFCEEACKALPLIWKARDSGFVSWRSAMLWGLISGVGFGVSEGITYSHDYYNGVMGSQIYLVRFISCVALHGIWAAATGINVFRRQDFFRGTMHPLEWVMQVGITVIVPMILHGLYDTLLKQDYNWGAVLIALASFGWLAWQIELAKKRLDPDPI